MHFLLKTTFGLCIYIRFICIYPCKLFLKRQLDIQPQMVLLERFRDQYTDRSTSKVMSSFEKQMRQDFKSTLGLSSRQTQQLSAMWLFPSVSLYDKQLNENMDTMAKIRSNTCN